MTDAVGVTRSLVGFVVRDFRAAVAILRDERQARKISQAAFGRTLGVSNNCVSQRESGQRSTWAPAFFDTAHALDFDVAMLPRAAGASAEARMAELIERAEPFLQICGNCDAGLSMSCTCPTGDYRNVMSALVSELQRLVPAAHPSQEGVGQ